MRHHLLLLILPNLLIEPVNGPDPIVPPLHQTHHPQQKHHHKQRHHPIHNYFLALAFLRDVNVDIYDLLHLTVVVGSASLGCGRLFEDV